MQVSSEINRLASLDATRRTPAPAPAGNSFATELASTQNLPSSLTGSSGGGAALGLSLSTLLQAQGAATSSSAIQPPTDPLNQPHKPTLRGGYNPLRSHGPILNDLAGSEGP